MSTCIPEESMQNYPTCSTGNLKSQKTVDYSSSHKPSSMWICLRNEVDLVPSFTSGKWNEVDLVALIVLRSQILDPVKYHNI